MMEIQRIDTLRRMQKQQQCHRPVNNVDNFRMLSKSHSINSYSTTIFMFISIISLLFFNHKVQALQSSVGLPPPAILQQLLQSEMDGTHTGDDNYNDGPILLPCCYDGLTARLVARHEMKTPSGGTSPKRFQATFMTGFGVSAVHGIPDTQLISYHEMMQSCTIISEALQSVATEQDLPHPIPCIAVRTL
jgi:hypothetical protein